MEALMKNHEVEAIISEFDELTQNPEIFIEPQLDKSNRFKQLAKKIYRFTVASNTLSKLKTKSLLKLLVEGFDDEQIWQQIEIQNKAAVSYFSNTVPTIKSCDVSFGIRGTISSQKPAVTQNESSDNDESKIEESYAFDDDSDSSTEMVKAVQKRVIEDVNDDEDYAFDDDDDNDSDSSAEILEADQKRPVPQKKLSVPYKSEVDDQFFKLSNLEEFLKIEDLKEENKDEDFSDKEDVIDLFQDIPSDGMDEFDEESDNEDSNKKSSRDLMYEDFFDAPEPEDGIFDGQADSNEMMNNEDDEAENISDDNMEDELDANIKDMENEKKLKQKKFPENSMDTPLQTTFEIEQEKIKMKIQEYEKSMLEPMPWHLTGEVAASSRPIDSLVHHETDFDSNAKQDLIIDSILTEKVENIIRMAIINKAFCDVERKVKPTDDAIAYKREIALDQTKSKKGLAEVYEEDYLKKQTKQEEEEDPKHKEIRKLMDSLLPELYALFSHMPKPAIPEIKIVSNLPAITVEEVAPTSVSDVTLLAPEEVKEKSGLVKGTTERTDTDRKRERRKKKIHQRLKEKKKQERLEKANPSAKMSKLEKLEALKKLKRNKNTKIANVDDGGKIKSSKDFFSRLQDTMESGGRNKMKVTSKKKKS